MTDGKEVLPMTNHHDQCPSPEPDELICRQREEAAGSFTYSQAKNEILIVRWQQVHTLNNTLTASLTTIGKTRTCSLSAADNTIPAVTEPCLAGGTSNLYVTVSSRPWRPACAAIRSQRYISDGRRFHSQFCLPPDLLS